MKINVNNIKKISLSRFDASKDKDFFGPIAKKGGTDLK